MEKAFVVCVCVQCIPENNLFVLHVAGVHDDDDDYLTKRQQTFLACLLGLPFILIPRQVISRCSSVPVQRESAKECFHLQSKTKSSGIGERNEMRE